MSRRAAPKSVKRAKLNRRSWSRRTVIVFTVATMLVAGGAILILRAGGQSEAQKPMAVNGLDASSPTKEMVFAGNRAVASEEGATTISFSDVPTTSPYYADIINIAGRGVTVGCGGGAYCASDTVTRGQMAAFIMRSLGEFNPPTPQVQRFVDVDPNNPFYRFIDRMYVLGITVGCNQIGQALYYCPNDSVTHGQMAAFMERALNNPSPASPAQASFCDVPAANIFFSLIEDYANLRRIWLGCSGTGTCPSNPPSNCSSPACNNNPGRCFCPDCPVKRDEMAHILVRAFNFY
jgi:hypothetical protein